MKNLYLLIILLVLNANYLSGQQPNSIKTFEHQLQGNLSLLKGQLTLEPADKSVDSENRVVVKTAEINNGDLLINFELAAFRSSEKKLILNVHPIISTPNGEILIAQPKYLEGNLENSFNSKTQQLQIKWNNFQNQYRFGEESIFLELNSQLVGIPPIDCNKPPVFGKQQKLLHYVIAGLSLGTTITGYVLENSSENLYQQYRSEVFEGELGTVASSTYNKANTRNKTGGFLKIVGYSAFGVNAVVYIFRQIRYNQKKKDYDYYCEQNKLRVQPYLNMQSQNAYAGMHLSYQF